MKNQPDKETLFRKFVNNECTPEEREWVFAYLQTDDADDALHAIIQEELLEDMGNENSINKQVSEEMYKNLSKELRKEEVKKSTGTQIPKSKGFRTLATSYWWMAAACTGVLFLAGIAYQFYTRSQIITYATAYGQTSTITLPDQSTVTLNGNSSIRYTAEWDANETREVWMQGEAYFSVKHTATDQKFIVNTSEQLNVEVLGTEFNVYNRKDRTRVVLNSGKVKLNRQDKYKISEVAMAPGQLVEFESRTAGYVKRDVNADIYSSWINKKIILENTSFREIAQLLEETYGLSVVVPDGSFYNERFTGVVPCENAGMLLNALSLSFNLKIHQKGNQVKFQSN